MVTKGYQKGVYERVTKGITRESPGAAGISGRRRDLITVFPAVSDPLGPRSEKTLTLKL